MGTAIVRRPTEEAAIAAAGRSVRVLSVPRLFAALLAAQAVGDRHGANLFGHAIARAGGAR
ncbi:hypothetical protein ACWGHU_12725 [Streptomyces xanthophaeus]